MPDSELETITRVRNSLKQAYQFPDSAPLQAIKDIQAAATAVRATYVPSDSFQATVYQEKRTSAERYIAAHDANETIDPDDYPYLSLEVGIAIDPETDAPTVDLLGVARAITEKATLWGSVIDPVIESVRRRLTSEVKAKDPADMDYLEFISLKGKTARVQIENAVSARLKELEKT